MAATTAQAPARELTDAVFYSRYEWCLNPMLSLGALLERTGEELRFREALPDGWQRDEAAINVYLFACAVACTAGDYLAYAPAALKAAGRRFPPAAAAAKVLQSVRRCGVAPWAAKWDGFVNRACAALLGGGDAAALSAEFASLACVRLPARALRWRMRIPEAFRCQDLSHHDVLAMAERLVERWPAGRRAVVIGPRTAGAYFAPLIAARLRQAGIRAEWIAIRPKDGLTRAEERRMKTLLGGDAAVVVTDDHPNTGRTFRLVLSLLAGFGVPAETVTVVAPEHPAQSDWTAAVRPAAVVSLRPECFYKRRLLEDAGSIVRLIAGLRPGWSAIRVAEGGEAVNRRFDLQSGDGFHVRFKRVYRVRYRDERGEPGVAEIIAKSAGWGWLGYHAYVAGTRLAGMTPEAIGLREGLLFSGWIAGTGRPSPERMGAYAAARAKRLALCEDPALSGPGYRWSGWDALARILSGAYGYSLGRLKAGAIARALREYASPLPALTDGRMTPEDWVGTAGDLRKADFEQHNFGGGEMDIVDPAYDLACAAFEFRLPEDEERRLVAAYARESGDSAAHGRVLLYKLLCGTNAMTTAARRIRNERYHDARRFLIHTLARHLGARLPGAPPEWTNRLFFLDLDGVLDSEFFGFPCTTPAGLKALAALRAGGWSVVLNTGRSLEEVREYCRHYALPGGVAEYGSVLWDAVRQAEVPLTCREDAVRLAVCRERAARLPGVFLDAAYRHAIRAYHYRGDRTAGLAPEEAAGLLCGFDGLRSIMRDEDTYILPRETDKGRALAAVKQYAGAAAAAAIGDSDQDAEMLAAADLGFAPANCSAALRRMVAEHRCAVMRGKAQRGLLAAAELLCGRPRVPLAAGNHVIDRLLACADRGAVRRTIAVLDPRL